MCEARAEVDRVGTYFDLDPTPKEVADHLSLVVFVRSAILAIDLCDHTWRAASAETPCVHQRQRGQDAVVIQTLFNQSVAGAWNWNNNGTAGVETVNNFDRRRQFT